jgi:hypothetical protein
MPGGIANAKTITSTAIPRITSILAILPQDRGGHVWIE